MKTMASVVEKNERTNYSYGKWSMKNCSLGDFKTHFGLSVKKLFFFIFFVAGNSGINAQLVEVQANYNSVGDVDFVAYNNTSAPLFVNIDFADLQNTSFNEPLPYIQKIEPGFNTLFTLLRDLDAGVPHFNYQIKYFRSDPMAKIDLDFPYLIPLAPGRKARVFDVKSIAGFWGAEEPESWIATGFQVKEGQEVYASRNGTVVEIAGEARTGDPQTWYHTWNNSITLLQADGTLICYRNVVDQTEEWKVGDNVFAGQLLGRVADPSPGLILLLYQNSLNSEELRFIIPRFVTGEDQTGLLISAKEYTVVHPEAVRGKEMTRRERRRMLRK